MNNTDQETVLRALEDARRIIGEFMWPGIDANQTVHRLIAVLDRDDVVYALERMRKRPTLRLVGRPE